MAKALLGYLSTTDPRVVAQLTAETRRLRQRVGDLEAQVLRLQSENDTLTASVRESALLALDEQLDQRRQPVSV